MPKVVKNAKQGKSGKRAPRSSTAHLDKLIEETTVDCYNESEEVTGLFTMIEDNLAVPFSTTLLGVEVTVERVDMNVAVCRRPKPRKAEDPHHRLATPGTKTERGGMD
jgi:hypothetical protein